MFVSVIFIYIYITVFYEMQIGWAIRVFGSSFLVFGFFYLINLMSIYSLVQFDWIFWFSDFFFFRNRFYSG